MVLELTDEEVYLLKTIVSIFPEVAEADGFQFTGKGAEAYASIIAKLSDPNELLGDENGD